MERCPQQPYLSDRNLIAFLNTSAHYLGLLPGDLPAWGCAGIYSAKYFDHCSCVSPKTKKWGLSRDSLVL
jgi:hypothetical protein